MPPPTQLGIAQPSVGRISARSNRQIGQPLFHRQRGSRPKLTKAGEALYTFAVDLLRRSEEATHALDDLRKIGAHEIAIAVHRDLLSGRYSAWLTTFTKRHPKAKIVTRTGTIEDVIALIREREVALGLFLSRAHGGRAIRDPVARAAAAGGRAATPAGVARARFP